MTAGVFTVVIVVVATDVKYESATGLVSDILLLFPKSQLASLTLIVSNPIMPPLIVLLSTKPIAPAAKLAPDAKPFKNFWPDTLLAMLMFLKFKLVNVAAFKSTNMDVASVVDCTVNESTFKRLLITEPTVKP